MNNSTILAEALEKIRDVATEALNKLKPEKPTTEALETQVELSYMTFREFVEKLNWNEKYSIF